MTDQHPDHQHPGHQHPGHRSASGPGPRIDVTNIDVLAAELLDEAMKHHSRRAARTIVSGVAQRATLIALLEGAELDEHVSPTAATLYVISGSVRLHTTGHEWHLHADDLAPIPPQRHRLHADTDAAVLLTVALR